MRFFVLIFVAVLLQDVQSQYDYPFLIDSYDEGGELRQACFGVCECDFGELTIDCSYRQLATIPDLSSPPFAAKRLLVDGNALTRIESQDLAPLNDLEELSAINNKIEVLLDSAFSHTPKLRTLDLTGNRLDYLSPVTMSEWSNSDLAILKLDTNAFIELPEFAIPQLSELTLSINGIQYIYNSPFRQLANLQKLDLDYNPIRRIDNDSLVGLSNLREFSARYGLLQSVPPPEIWEPVHVTLESLSLAHSSRLVMMNELGPMPSLKRLDLSFCPLQLVENSSLEGAPALEFLDLAYARLEELPPEIFVSSSSSLLTLNITGNSFRLIPYEALRPLVRLRRLTADDLNSLRQLHDYNVTQGGGLLTSLATLELSRNRIARVGDSSFLTGLSSLTTFEMSDTRLEEFPAVALASMTSLEDFTFSGNLITTINSTSLPVMASLLELAVQSSPSLVSVDNLAFSQVGASLVGIKLSSNPVLESIEPRAFEDLMQLDHLDISNNALRVAHTEWVEGKSLTEFGVDGNRWDCDCLMEPFKDQMTSLIDVIPVPPTCYYPRLSRGKPIADVTSFPCDRACPDDCVCYDAMTRPIDEMNPTGSADVAITTVNCAAARLEEVPTSQLSGIGVRHLQANGNQLRRFESDAGMSDLVTLNLASNLIDQFPTLDTCDGLVLLDLSYNFIAEVNSTHLRNLGKLETLILSNNQLVELESDTFEYLNSLQTLILSNNGIQTLPSGIFASLNALRALHLGGNQIREMKADFIASPSLEFLDVRGCVITSVSNDSLSSMPKLRTFLVGSNSIKELRIDGDSPQLVALNAESNLLEELPRIGNTESLASLQLASNSISSLDADSFPALRFLDVSYNALDQSPSTPRPAGLDAVRTLLMSGCGLRAFPWSWITSSLARVENLALDSNPIAEVQIYDVGLDESPKKSWIRSLSLRFMPQLVEIGDSAFSQLERLDHVTVSSSPLLTSVYGDAFGASGGRDMQVLDLHDNALTTPDAAWFALSGNPQHVDLHGNPWACDCAAVPFVAWWRPSDGGAVQHGNASTTTDAVICQSPEHLKGRNLLDMEILEFCPEYTTTTRTTTVRTTVATTEETTTTTTTVDTDTDETTTEGGGGKSKPEVLLLLVTLLISAFAY